MRSARAPRRASQWRGRLLDRVLVGLGPAVGALLDRLDAPSYEAQVFAGRAPLDGAGLGLRAAYLAKLAFGARHGHGVDHARAPSRRSEADPTIVLLGDVLSVPELGHDSISPGLRARLATAQRVVVNLEGTAHDGPPRASFAPFFSWAGVMQLARFARDRDVAGWTSDVSAAALAAAFDGVAPIAVGLANNHAFDRGLAGLVETRAALAAEGMIPFGYDHAGTPEDVVLAVGARRVGLVTTTFGHNRADQRPRVASRFSALPYRVDAAAYRARAEALRRDGASVVIAWLHWGYEHEHSPRADMLASAETLFAAGFDAVVGHHPHTFQTHTIDTVTRDDRDHLRVAAYALGDCIGGDRTAWSRFGLALELAIGAHGVSGVTAIPIAQTPSWAGPARTCLLAEASAGEQALFTRAHAWKLAQPDSAARA